MHLQTSANKTLDSDPISALTRLKAIYDSLNEKRMESDVKVKRDFWQWLKDTFEAPGMKARSAAPISVSPVSYEKRTSLTRNLSQTPDNSTSDSDTVATLTHLKAIYDSLNAKRTEGGLKAKRGFWQWLEDHTYCEIGIPCE